MAKIPHSANRTGASCTICGYQPQTAADESTWSPILYWSPDDGWMIGALCEPCIEHYATQQPDPSDYAYLERHAAELAVLTDEDVSDIF